MKKEMDLFGEALLAYYNGDKSELFIEDEKGNKSTYSLSKYFRKHKQFERLEREIISLSKGKILDVGCGPGNYIPYLEKKGKVIGIDISPNVINVCKKRGIKNVIVADIFNFKTKEKFDTIVFLENNLGMAETIPKTKKLLKILYKLLSDKGQILTNGREVVKGKYRHNKIRFLFGDKKGKYISWMEFNSKYLTNICNELGLKMKILDREGHHYLAKITK